MSNPIQRDTANLSWGDFLDDYFTRTKHDIEALVASALRTKSLGLREVIARGTFAPGVSLREMKDRVLRERSMDAARVIDPYLLGELGRVILLQNICPDDVIYGAKLLEWAHGLDESCLSKKARRTLVQYYVVTKEYVRAEKNSRFL